MTLTLTLSATSVAANIDSVIATLTDSEGDLVLIAEDLVINPAVLEPVTENPLAGTCAAVRRSRDGNLRVVHHYLLAAGTSFHQVKSPNAVSVGALRLALRDQERVVPVLRELRDFALKNTSLGARESIELIITALLRAQIQVKEVELVDAPWFRSPANVEQACEKTQAQTETTIRRLQANRVDDGFYSTFVVRKLSKPLTGLAIRLGLSPNAVTSISFLIGLLAAAAFAAGSRWFLIIGAILLQLSLVIDCVDGEVARATSRFSTLGAWLDASTDRVKEYAAYAGLAAGAVAVGINNGLAWSVALVLMVVQTARHMGDYNFAVIQRIREGGLPLAALTDPDDPWGAQSGAIARSAQINSRPVVRWTKKVIHLPIGERWLVLSVVAVIVNGYWALLTLLVLTSLAWLYTLVGRVLRTLRWLREPAGVQIIADQLDAGPLLGSLPTRWKPAPTSRWNWSFPMLLRILEMGIVAWIAIYAFPQWEALAFAYLFIIAFHHYDSLYRALSGSRAPRWITWSALGVDGRTVLIVLASLIGNTAFHSILNLGVAWLFMWCVVIASAQYLGAQKKMELR
ncbi:MAG: DUF5941 domain-containing protein [Actinomycetota bacterium]|nr:DUF5941 domain-containing protein [Actinomycetota bacterium]